MYHCEEDTWLFFIIYRILFCNIKCYFETSFDLFLQGFICPQCMKSLGSADELFKHYEAAHDAGHDPGHGGEAPLARKRSVCLGVAAAVTVAGIT